MRPAAKVVQILDYQGWGSIGPDAIEAGRALGGRETCMVQVSGHLARQEGLEVINFTAREESLRREYESGGSETWVPIKGAKAILSTLWHDILISWEFPQVFEDPEIVARTSYRVMSLQCADVPGVTPAVRDAVDRWVALSDWHAEYFGREYGIRRGRFTVIPNGVDLARYDGARPGRDHKKPFQFYYASSPDRGLSHLLRLWPKLRAELPKAELHVCYGARDWANNAKWSHHEHGDEAAEILALMDQPGIVDRGKVSKDDLAHLAIESQMLLYPCDCTLPTETGCITIMDALAAMTPVVTTSADCLGSEFGGYTVQVDLPFDPDRYLTEVMELFYDSKQYETFQDVGREWVVDRDWQNIMDTGWVPDIVNAAFDNDEW